LTSSNTSVATIASSVVVPAGSSSSKPIDVQGHASGTATITAIVFNASAASQASASVQVFQPQQPTPQQPPPIQVVPVLPSSPTNAVAIAGQVQSGSQSQSQQNAKMALPFSYTSPLTMARDRCSGA
jgi:hypothetical protein